MKIDAPTKEIETEEITRDKKCRKEIKDYKKEFAWQAVMRRNIKKYEEELHHKLPNEFRNCLQGYNPYNTMYSNGWQDDNDYNFNQRS